MSMSISSFEVGQFRADAEALMLDTFAIYAPTGMEQNASGQESMGYAPRGSTRGKLHSASRIGNNTAKGITVGGVERKVVEEGIHVPVSSPAPTLGELGIGWEYVLTRVGPSTPSSLSGSRWLVIDQLEKSFMTARRLHVVRLA